MAIKFSWKKALVHYFYGTIANLVNSLIGSFGLALNRDLVVAAIAYFLVPRWDEEIAEALFYGAIQSLGATGGLSLGAVLGGTTSAATASAQRPVRRMKVLV